jgi:HlyD family secretion protein
MELKSNEKRGAEELFKLGYAGRSEVEQYRLDYLQAEGQFASKVNKLRTQLATLKKKKTFEREMQVLTLNGSQETAKRNLEQVNRDNEALLEQASAAKDAADEGRRKEEERLARYKKYLDNCKIYAPADGMVAYAVADARAYWMDEIREGATVRLRQHILSLPNLKLMQVKTSIHESMLEQVQPGLTASVRMEAFPDRQYEGKVKSIAVLAGGQGSDTKVYDTIVTIDGEVEGLRPGMTAVVDIRVARLKDVLSVPVQAITQIDDETFCYVESGRDVERRVLKLGRTNDKFVDVKEGLEEGDRVVLNPMSILEEEEKDQDELSPEDEFDLELEGTDDTESKSDAIKLPETQSSPSDRTGKTPQPGSSQRKAGGGAGPSGRTKSPG